MPIPEGTIYQPEELSGFPASIWVTAGNDDTIRTCIENAVYGTWYCIEAEYYKAHVYLCDNPEATVNDLI